MQPERVGAASERVCSLRLAVRGALRANVMRRRVGAALLFIFLVLESSVELTNVLHTHSDKYKSDT